MKKNPQPEPESAGIVPPFFEDSSTPEFQVWLDHIFTYHAPDVEDIAACGAIREAAKDLVRVIIERTPLCADQTTAIRKVREAVMTANAARALKGAV